MRSPARTIWRGTMLGYALGPLVFLLAAIVVAGILPNEKIGSSARPIAMVVERAVGPIGAWIISGCAIVAGLGTLNGWMLVSGRAPVSGAQDGLFFKRIAAVHPRFRTPVFALVCSAAVGSLMLCLMLNRTLLETFNFIVLLAVWATLVPHLITAAAELALVRRDAHPYTAIQRPRTPPLPPPPF